MLFEEVLFLISGAIAIFFIGIPSYKLIKSLIPTSKIDPLFEAKKRLEIAKKEVEASNLNKETEALYKKMYEEVLEEEDISMEDKETKISK